MAYNNRQHKRALWALDSQQVARVCGGRYMATGVHQANG
jgi:hypothetical protein